MSKEIKEYGFTAIWLRTKHVRKNGEVSNGKAKDSKSSCPDDQKMVKSFT